VSPSGARAWITHSAAQAPRVRWGVPSPQTGSPNAICALGSAHNTGSSQVSCVPTWFFFDNNNNFLKFINDDDDDDSNF